MNRPAALPPIESRSISEAWAQAFLRVTTAPKQAVETLVVKIHVDPELTPVEDGEIRSCLDAALSQSKFSSNETVAGTIFPVSLWNRTVPRTQLYERYASCWSRISKCSENRFGTYFRRMTAFETVPEEKAVNQLEKIITAWNSGLRRNSAFQLAIFDPRADHRPTPYMGFPCLHQVSFTPLGPNGSDGLAITGYYATQHLFRKAYGNYLGLYRLGEFVAKETQLKLATVTCIASLAKLGDLGEEPGFAKEFTSKLRSLLKEALAS